MKRIMLILTALLTLFCGGALALTQGNTAEVVRCESYVTLRASASKKAEEVAKLPLGTKVLCLGGEQEGFSEVSFGGRTGWVLTEYLEEEIAEEEGEPVTLSDAATIMMNLYLTAFAQANLNSYQRENTTADQVIAFACDYLRFYEKDKLETGIWPQGDTRVQADEVQAAARTMLGLRPKNRTAAGITYGSGCYYWTESQRQGSGGFAVVDSVSRLADGTYRVSFGTYGAGESWTPEGICMFTPKRARNAYEHDTEHQGTAVIDCAGHPEDSQGWKLLMFAVN